MLDSLSPDLTKGGSKPIKIDKRHRHKWCLIRIGNLPAAPAYISFCVEQSDFSLTARMSHPVSLPAPLLPRSRFALTYIPENAENIRLYTTVNQAGRDALDVDIRAIPRWGAGLILAASSPLRLLSLLKSAFKPPREDFFHRIRSKMALLAVPLPRAMPYRLWATVFDDWSAFDRDTLLRSPRRAEWPSIEIILFRSQGDENELTASLDSLNRQWYPALTVKEICATDEDQPGPPHRISVADGKADYLAVLQAGEILPPHALAVLADQAARGGLDVIYADEDQIDAEGVRSSPHFKPELGPTLLASGTLTRGVWMFRRETLKHLSPSVPGHHSAEAARLELIFSLLQASSNIRARRIPFVLTHLRHDMAATSPAILGRIVQNFLSASAPHAEVDMTSLPLRIHWRCAGTNDGEALTKVSFIVPTAAKSRHVTQCLQQILAQTSYANFEMIIVVSQNCALNETQKLILKPLLETGKVTVSVLNVSRFSFSAAINYGVSLSGGELVCLLNDDVAPIDGDWLSKMVGHIQDRGVGAVGAKLLYGNNTVQHGGVVMGLAGLCEHTHRHLPAQDPGYHSRAILDQDVSCVTGACLLTRRAIFDAVGGLDEGFEIAFNDVDFCLRVREAGWRIIFCATAILWHYESLSLGHHFSGDRAELEQVEIQKMRRRWQNICAADPFHNPNLSLQMGHEWEPAYPPRVSKPFAEIRFEDHGVGRADEGAGNGGLPQSGSAVSA